MDKLQQREDVVGGRGQSSVRLAQGGEIGDRQGVPADEPRRADPAARLTPSQLVLVTALRSMTAGSSGISASGGWYPPRLVAEQAGVAYTTAQAGLSEMAGLGLIKRRTRLGTRGRIVEYRA